MKRRDGAPRAAVASPFTRVLRRARSSLQRNGSARVPFAESRVVALFDALSHLRDDARRDGADCTHEGTRASFPKTLGSARAARSGCVRIRCTIRKSLVPATALRRDEPVDAKSDRPGDADEDDRADESRVLRDLEGDVR